MPTWGNLQKFTWSELLVFRYAHLTEHEVDLLQKCWSGELQVPPDISEKVQELCQPFADEYYKRYRRKLSIKDLLASVSSATTLIRNLQAMGEEYQEPFQTLVHDILDSLRQMLS